MAGAALRAVVSLAYWPGLELGYDSFLYLGHAQSLTPETWHPFGYSAFLWALSVFGSVDVVPIVQHLLGLGLAVLIYAFLVRLRVRRGWALIATLPVLLDGYQLDIEQFVLAETLVDALVVSALVLLAWNRRVTPGRAAAVGALLVAATLTRFAAAPLLVLVAAYLILRGSWRSLLAYSGVAVAMLLGYGAWYASNHGTFGYTDYSGYMLYARVAPFATCHYDLPPRAALLCPRQPVSKRTQDTEFYTWYQGSPLYQRGLGDHHQRNVLAKQFARAVIEHQPVTYAEHVVSDTWHYFTPGRWMTSATVELTRYRFPDAATNYGTDNLHVTLANHGFGNRTIRWDPSPSLYGFLRAYQRVVYTQGPILLAALIGGLAAALGLLRSRARRRHARWAAALFAIGGFLIVFVPSLTAAFSYRSGIPLLVMLPIGGVIGADMATDAWLAKGRQRRLRVLTVAAQPRASSPGSPRPSTAAETRAALTPGPGAGRPRSEA